MSVSSVATINSITSCWQIVPLEVTLIAPMWVVHVANRVKGGCVVWQMHLPAVCLQQHAAPGVGCGQGCGMRARVRYLQPAHQDWCAIELRMHLHHDGADTVFKGDCTMRAILCFLESYPLPIRCEKLTVYLQPECLRCGVLRGVKATVIEVEKACAVPAPPNQAAFDERLFVDGERSPIANCRVWLSTVVRLEKQGGVRMLSCDLSPLYPLHEDARERAVLTTHL